VEIEPITGQQACECGAIVGRKLKIIAGRIAPMASHRLRLTNN
jgi:hypothetical protein